MTEDLAARAAKAFAPELAQPPPMSLRGGNDVDSYDTPTPYDPVADRLDDAYIEKHAYFALPHLDPDSWRHYLAPLIAYALERKSEAGNLVIDGLIWGFFPPDRDPPRFGSLTVEQEAVVVAFLDVMAFDETSQYSDDAIQALEEWWGPKARYRPQA
jgi:hypothetical protein